MGYRLVRFHEDDRMTPGIQLVILHGYERHALPELFR